MITFLAITGIVILVFFGLAFYSMNSRRPKFFKGELKAFEKSLATYTTAKSSVQFQLNKPLPLDLITRMVKLRVQESLTGDAKWKE